MRARTAHWLTKLLMSAPLAAADVGSYDNSRLETITVTATGVSNMAAASAGDVSPEEIAAEPLLRPGAVHENVPGMIVTGRSALLFV